MSDFPSRVLTSASAGRRERVPVHESELRLRRMGLQDLQFVVRTHLRYFPDSFFARLGSHFLTRYYRTFLDGPPATATVAEVDGEVLGYVVGVFGVPRNRSLLLRHHGAGLAWAGLLAMCRRPWLAWRFASTRVPRYARALLRSDEPSTDIPRSTGKLAVLSYVAVAEPFRLRGVGTQLVNDFLQQAEIAGCARACLVTLAGDSGAGGYYESHQWERVQVPASRTTTALKHYQRRLCPKDQSMVPDVQSSATS